MPAPPDALGDLTSDQVARLDAAAVACGVSTLQLMEVAGWQVARCAWQRLGGAAAISVIAGYGNNGGDGLVAARHLATWGCGVRVLVLGTESRVTGVVAGHVLSARKLRDRRHHRRGSRRPWSASSRAAELVVDAILGTGLRSAPREAQADAIRAINESAIPVLSVDVPSGLDATTGEAFDPTVRATLTCTLTAMKRGLRRGDGAASGRRDLGRGHRHAGGRVARAGLLQPPGVTGGELVHTSS